MYFCVSANPQEIIRHRMKSDIEVPYWSYISGGLWIRFTA